MEHEQPSQPRTSTRAGFLTAAAIGMTGSQIESALAANEHPSVPSLSPTQALTRLLEGNKRYAADIAINCNKNYDRRAEVAGGQHPFAIVLGCSDSRVPPETVFDQRIGDLFTIRLAGNVADSFALGSIEYAVEHFKPPLLVVLGHSRCGAGIATLDIVKTNGSAPGHIAALVDAIKPAATSALDMPGDTLNNAIDANVRAVVASLPQASPIIAEAVQAKRLQLAGAHYELTTGIVTLLT